MAKSIRKKQTPASKSQTGITIPEKYQDWIYIGMIILAVFIFFWDVVTGFEIAASDNYASISFKTYLENASDKGEFPLWIPYIFSGTPSYGSLMLTGDRWWDIGPELFFGFTRFMGDLFANDSVRVMTFYIFLGIGMYLLMRMKKFERFIAFFTAIAAIFSTGYIHWIMIGHNTKPIAMAALPYIIMLLERLREKWSWTFGILLIFAVHIFFESVHIQMMFYGMGAIGIYLLFEFVSRIISKKQPMNVVKVAAAFAVASALAFSMSADRYLSVQEYTPYSTRGSAPIVQSEDADIGDHGGNDYEYATEWSFSPQEIVTFFVPNYYGFGKLKYDGPEVRQPVKVLTYWGQKIFEDVAPYMGIVVLFLGITGAIYYRRDVFVQFLIVLSVFMLFLSFGKNLSFLYDLFFHYFPSFNKFRAPSMSLAMVQFAFPILAGYGLQAFFKWRRENDAVGGKYLKGYLIAAAAFLGLGLLFAVAFKDLYISAVQNSGNQNFQSMLQQLPAISGFIWDSMINDWLVIAVLNMAFAILVYFFVKNKVSRPLFYVAAGLILFIDLWRVGWRPLEVPENDEVKNAYRNYDIVQGIKQDTSTFRIADMGTLASISPNMWAYYQIESVGGYHSAKLRVYQDLLDNADQGSTSYVTAPFLWRLMNVKYVITPQQQGQGALFTSQQTGWSIYRSPGYLPRAFFVDSVAVKKPLEILEHLKAGDFEPRQLAYLEEELGEQIVPPGPEASAWVAEHQNHRVKINVNATGNNFLYISEVYYPAGWKAFIDGKETKIHKTNFAFRGIVVPEGEHEIELKFESEAFQQGKTISMAVNGITIIALLAAFFIERRRKKVTEAEEKDEK